MRVLILLNFLTCFLVISYFTKSIQFKKSNLDMSKKFTCRKIGGCCNCKNDCRIKKITRFKN